jgi:hypothetical protein
VAGGAAATLGNDGGREEGGRELWRRSRRAAREEGGREYAQFASQDYGVGLRFGFAGAASTRIIITSPATGCGSSTTRTGASTRLLLIGLSCANPNCEECPAMQIGEARAEEEAAALLVFSSRASIKLQEITFASARRVHDHQRGDVAPRSDSGDIER